MGIYHDESKMFGFKCYEIVNDEYIMIYNKEENEFSREDVKTFYMNLDKTKEYNFVVYCETSCTLDYNLSVYKAWTSTTKFILDKVFNL